MQEKLTTYIQFFANNWVSLKHGVTHWCSHWRTLVLWDLDKIKVFFQFTRYLVNSEL